MSEGITDSQSAVPFQTVQEVADRMEPVPVRYDVDRFLDQLLGSDPIGPFAVKMDVVQVVVIQTRPGASTVPSEILHDIDPLCQLVVTDRLAEKGIIRQDRFCVCDQVPYLTFLRRFQKIHHGLCRHVRL